MITELLLIAAANVIDPMDMSGHQMYPSGVKECDKYPRYPYPDSKLAKLSIGQNILASDNQVIKGGHYLVSLSVSRNEILLFEGQKALYAINVSSIETMDKPYKFAEATFVSSDNSECFIILKQGKYLVTAKVDLYRPENLR